MADPQKPSSDQKFFSQQAEVRSRISELQRQLDNLNQEVTHIRGQLLNLDPLLTSRMQRRNQELCARMANLEKALYSMLHDAGASRTQEEERTKREMLSRSAAEYFEKLNIDPHLWKNLES